MTYQAIGRSVLALLLGVALLAAIVAFVPGPFQVLATLVALPIESLLLAFATSTGRRASESGSSWAR